MSTRAPGTTSVHNDAAANAQAITAALAMQHASPLPFTLDDCITLGTLAECLEAAGHRTRAYRVRRLYTRLGTALADVRAGDEPEHSAELTICDAADVWWSRSCRGLASDERERAHLLAFRIMRAVDYAQPRVARFALTASGRAAMLEDDGHGGHVLPFSVDREG